MLRGPGTNRTRLFVDALENVNQSVFPRTVSVLFGYRGLEAKCPVHLAALNLSLA